MPQPTFRASQLQRMVYAAIAVAGISAVVGLGLREFWIEMVLSLAFSTLALAVATTGWRTRFAGPTFAGFALVGGGGLLQGMPALFGLLTLAAALIAWDLHHYGERLAQVGRIEEESSLLWAHLRLLFGTVGVGLVLGGMGLLMRVDYGVGAILILGFVLALGLTQAVSYLRKQSD